MRKLPEECHTNKKSCMCFVDIGKVFDRVPRKVLEWAMMKKTIPVLVRLLMSMYYMAVRHGSHTDVISGYWSPFTSDVSS